MADKGPGSTGRSNKKRLARAKIKPTDEGIKSAKGRAPEKPEVSKAQQKKARQQKITAIAVGAFAVIMALSMMLPSLSYIFGNSEEQQAAQQAQQEAEAAAKEEAEASDDGEEEKELTGVAKIDKAYKAVIDPLEAKLADNPKDLATLLHLGKDYMSWGIEVGSSATGEEDYEHMSELLKKAMGYCDQYLELNDSTSVRCDRAMCQLYTGDLDGALEALGKIAEDEGYGPAWANIGMIRELYQSDRDGAKEAYQKAIEADPDDEYGSKSYANRRLAAMVASENNGKIEDAATEAADSGDTKTSTGASALEEALKAHQ